MLIYNTPYSIIHHKALLPTRQLSQFSKDVLAQNYELKLQNDDYKAMDPVIARRDFIDRVRAYER